jgi:UDPglucose 6-dehydrogenase
MKICVFGLWHLGCVTAACLAQAGHSVIGLDFDDDVVSGLRSGRAPLFEPGLDALIAAGIASGRLTSSTDAAVVADCDIVWVTFDTPVDEDDRADVALIEAQVGRIFQYLGFGAVMLISSQLPAGSTRRIANAYARSFPSTNCHFAYST